MPKSIPFCSSCYIFPIILSVVAEIIILQQNCKVMTGIFQVNVFCSNFGWGEHTLICTLPHTQHTAHMHTHAYMHTCIHTCTHTCTHAHTYTVHMHACTCSNMCTHTHMLPGLEQSVRQMPDHF